LFFVISIFINFRFEFYFVNLHVLILNPVHIFLMRLVVLVIIASTNKNLFDLHLLFHNSDILMVLLFLLMIFSSILNPIMSKISVIFYINIELDFLLIFKVHFPLVRTLYVNKVQMVYGNRELLKVWKMIIIFVLYVLLILMLWKLYHLNQLLLQVRYFYRIFKYKLFISFQILPDRLKQIIKMRIMMMMFPVQLKIFRVHRLINQD
jgi:hypothetical protein